MKSIINKILVIEHGFKSIEREAISIFNSKSGNEINTIINELIDNNSYQVRSLAVFLLGFKAYTDSKALEFLKNKVGQDPSWQVQEILAKAFDNFCSKTGYEHAIPVINEWLNDTNPNVCRAVIEGLRIWTGRSYFKTHPEIAIQLISKHKASDSQYLRKSVGNALRDISKKHKYLVENELLSWDLTDQNTLFTYKLVRK